MQWDSGQTPELLAVGGGHRKVMLGEQTEGQVPVPKRGLVNPATVVGRVALIP
jgi:hypothetical protein